MSITRRRTPKSRSDVQGRSDDVAEMDRCNLYGSMSMHRESSPKQQKQASSCFETGCDLPLKVSLQASCPGLQETTFVTSLAYCGSGERRFRHWWMTSVHERLSVQAVRAVAVLSKQVSTGPGPQGDPFRIRCSVLYRRLDSLGPPSLMQLLHACARQMPMRMFESGSTA